jgi:hypothetical protein
MANEISDAAAGFLVGAGEGAQVLLGGLAVQFKLRAGQTAGRLSITEMRLDPYRLVAPHVHADEDEYTYVAAGKIGVRVADEEFEAMRPRLWRLRRRWPMTPDPASRQVSGMGTGQAGLSAIWELSTLAAEWHRTYSGTRPDLARALEFYDRWLPGTMRRIPTSPAHAGRTAFTVTASPASAP